MQCQACGFELNDDGSCDECAASEFCLGDALSVLFEIPEGHASVPIDSELLIIEKGAGPQNVADVSFVGWDYERD